MVGDTSPPGNPERDGLARLRALLARTTDTIVTAEGLEAAGISTQLLDAWNVTRFSGHDGAVCWRVTDLRALVEGDLR